MREATRRVGVPEVQLGPSTSSYLQQWTSGHLSFWAMEKSFEQRQEAVLKVCKALWWKEDMERYGEAIPSFTRQTTNTQALVLGRGLSWLC